MYVTKDSQQDAIFENCFSLCLYHSFFVLAPAPHLPTAHLIYSITDGVLCVCTGTLIFRYQVSSRHQRVLLHQNCVTHLVVGQPLSFVLVRVHKPRSGVDFCPSLIYGGNSDVWTKFRHNFSQNWRKSRCIRSSRICYMF